ncbi:MAG: hypothetical protein K9N46_09570 [Candidatus Marinimicrobia bacterium]|nr:hypothetical protein [Candidatus Neomarinimicrobiota bacterium]MCF7828433.1 hypothetical protein [Candidatus Neomarinimicrobiota bacterium]MCF7880973.1 hypothetical protein [Candidatus Neomarinimicrobiota bacterium]
MKALGRIAVTIITVIFFSLAGCTQEPVAPETEQTMNNTPSETEYQTALAKGNQAKAHEIRLAHFAKALAKAQKHDGVGAYLKERIGEKFDGDYEVLWNDVKSKQIQGVGQLRRVVQGKLKGGIPTM